MKQQPRYVFELLSEAHDVSGFDCHNTFLSQFLKGEALFQTQNDLSRTYVLLDRKEDKAGEVIGYFTVQSDSFYDSQKRNGGTIPVVLLSFD